MTHAVLLDERPLPRSSSGRGGWFLLATFPAPFRAQQSDLEIERVFQMSVSPFAAIFLEVHKTLSNALMGLIDNFASLVSGRARTSIPPYPAAHPTLSNEVLQPLSVLSGDFAVVHDNPPCPMFVGSLIVADDHLPVTRPARLPCPHDKPAVSACAKKGGCDGQ